MRKTFIYQWAKVVVEPECLPPRRELPITSTFGLFALFLSLNLFPATFEGPLELLHARVRNLHFYNKLGEKQKKPMNNENEEEEEETVNDVCL